jgi:branched-chain amino acid transport system permease protein
VHKTQLLAFGISSFYLGIAGALWAFTYLGTVEPHGFDLSRSFQVLFIIIIGGMGSILGSFLGAAFIVLFPILLSNVSSGLLAGAIDPGQLENFQKMIFGALIIFFLIKEPNGLAKVWQTFKQRLRVWPLRF